MPADLTSIRDPLSLSVLAEAYADAGEAANAEEVVDLALTRASLMQDRVAGLEASRVRAWVLAMRGRPEEASTALEEALSLARSMPHPYAEGKILREHGMLNVRKAEPEQARERLSAALLIFRRLGAREDAGRTERALEATVRSRSR